MKTILSIQSNVVYGYAGNKVATLPMQLLNVEVMPIHTVQLSSNTVYQNYDGIILGERQISRIIDSLEKIGQLGSIDAVISGYIGSAEQGYEILDAVNKIRRHNPKMIYVCDPVMGGDIDKGSALPPDIIDFFINHAIHHADYITPNLLELQILSQQKLNNFNDVLHAIDTIIDKNDVNILVKNLLYTGKNPEQFEMIIATDSIRNHLTRPLYDFPHRPLGVGDLICATFTAHLVNGKSDIEAFESAANIANDVLRITKKLNSRELEIIAAQDKIRHPVLHYRSVTL